MNLLYQSSSLSVFCIVCLVFCLVTYNQYGDPSLHRITKRASLPSSTTARDGLQVDLGYEIYQGFYDSESKNKVWLGIRYAASPTGSNRWRAPQSPVLNNDSIINANTNPTWCPQGSSAPYDPDLPYHGDEDCLFLNVYAPAGSQNAAVIVWFHGGGYGGGYVGTFPSALQLYSPEPFVVVDVQYRLGAFGFLSSNDIHIDGTLNVGLLDQQFALQWVNRHISLFGGNPSNVTIAGQSAGAGSVMLQTMAFGGRENTTYFQKAIAASPYLPMQHNYSDPFPEAAYVAFADAAGCSRNTSSNVTVLDCLRSTDTSTLQLANAKVSASGAWGTWLFTPVTDSSFLPDIPSKFLEKQALNGHRLLVSHVANEGVVFVPQNITTENSLRTYVRLMYPHLTDRDLETLWSYYPIDFNSTESIHKSATKGNGKHYNNYTSALLSSSYGIQYQQLANNIYAESTLVCPAYWLADGFSSTTTTSSATTRKSYLYQYSVPAAPHGSDIACLTVDPAKGNTSIGIGPDFAKAMQRSWTSFIAIGDPSIPTKLLNGHTRGLGGGSGVKLMHWPAWKLNEDPHTTKSAKKKKGRKMGNFNQTGGHLYLIDSLGIEVLQSNGSGLRNAFEVVNADSWEMGRGARCDFWKQIGSDIPE